MKMESKFESDLDSWRWDGDRPELASTAHSAASWCVDLVRPSVITRSGPRKQVRRTAYLDGLRGFAAFLVYWQHHELWPLRSVPANRILENGYGFENRYYFASLPVVRTFFTGGHFAVAVFFVISGYVLSAKPLSMVHARDSAGLVDSLGSALFRRWLRLHIPVILVTFVYMVSWHAFGGIWTLSPEHKLSFREELWNWYTEFKNFSFMFRTGGNPWFSYNFPTWSLPVEFRGSVIVWTSLLAFARASKNARLGCQVGLIVYFLYIADGWFGAMFIAGMLLCDLDLLARNDDLPSFLSKIQASRWKTPLCYGLLFIASILSGVPSHGIDRIILTQAPGWRYLAWMTPQAVFDHKWFYLFWAAICLIASVPRIWWLKAFFETSFNQYLGRISFSLYLVHGPILWTLGDRLYVAVGWYKEAHEVNIPTWVNIFPLSKGGPLGLEPSFLVPHLILLPLTLWLSEVVTKLCDEPSVKFSQWIYSKILGAPKEPMELHG